MRFFNSQIDDFSNLRIQFIDGGFEASIVSHEFPNTNGAKLESMGAKARRFRFVVWFFKKDYERAEPFRKYIQENRKVSFLHPRWGLIYGQISAVNDRDDDLQPVASFDITLIEEAVTDAPVVQSVDVIASTETAFLRSIEEQKTIFTDSLRGALGTEADDVLSQDLDPDLGILGQFVGLSVAARAKVAQIDGAVSTLEGVLSTVSSPANSVLSLVEWGTSLPDRVIGSVANTIDRYVAAIESVRSFPARFADAFYGAMQDLVSSVAGLADSLTIGAASRGAVEVARSYALDEANRDIVRRLERAKAFSVDGTYLRTEIVPAIATIDDLERSLYTAREWLQRGVDISREQRALKDAAESLMRHVNSIKLERERIAEVVVAEETPLHLVCHQAGLPYTFAERVLSLNPQIHNPSSTRGKVKIYAR